MHIEITKSWLSRHLSNWLGPFNCINPTSVVVPLGHPEMVVLSCISRKCVQEVQKLSVSRGNSVSSQTACQLW